jgi:hypothetical protein
MGNELNVMRKNFKNFMKGIGSVMEIMPYTDYRRFVPKMTQDLSGVQDLSWTSQKKSKKS